MLGRGAYGEVRKGVWRGISVAAKRLHLLTGGNRTFSGSWRGKRLFSAFFLAGMTLHEDELEVVRQQFLQEMEILSYLRHPNLLLFIGVSYDPSTRTPLWIITELMKNSLYGILHDLRLDLTLSEVVDIAVGVASGLEVRRGRLGMNSPCKSV
jgi:serine/threonine protein kinase